MNSQFKWDNVNQDTPLMPRVIAFSLFLVAVAAYFVS